MDTRISFNNLDSVTSSDQDAGLTALEQQLIALAAELDRSVSDLSERADEYVTAHDEALLARLDPIERAIMETPANTLKGLSIKARHLAYVLSEYWEAPIDQIEWQGRAIRLLIEAICKMAHAPVHIRQPNSGK
ncbi:hypothetical protein ACQR16_31045 [Bradyrhizobium oligotrophicum]|uniref:Uncharacterized protein n=1 Tax=Bradyrhizobium ontarionense TaxID=2898149 RepID=A0ABY3RMP1_9BRAD|nr:hypothetical protein [Bradyrhizobium sp. A19]UFZ08063.1 hypothetical protein LQG66_17975 [Bradyrhizobium sp. A19]